MRRLYLILRRAVVAVFLLFLLLIGYTILRNRPQDLPWTDLDLAQPIGLFTGRKLAALTGDAPGCRALLEKAGVPFVAVEPGGEGQCSFADAVRLKPQAGAIDLVPAGVSPSCPVAAALKLWEWHVVQPEARRLLGQAVRSVTHFGSYSCRRIYGRSSGDFSEHATADAIDISGFVLDNGRRISVIGGWKGTGRDAAFLRAVRDGACGLFSTVLPPDYNAAHRDHLHLDQATRGATGWRGCR